MTAIQISDRQSNFQIVKAISSNAISSLTGGMFAYGMGLMLLHDTHSPLSFGLDLIITPIIGLLFFIPIGNYVDRHHHKMILISSYILRLVALAIFALMVKQFSPSMRLIPVAIFLTISAILSNLGSTTYSASVHELVNQNKISPLSSFTQACSAGSQILAPILGVVLYSVVSFETFIGVEIIGTAVAFLILLTMKFFEAPSSKTDEQPKTEAGQLEGFKEGLNYVQKRSFLKDMAIMASFLNAVATVLTVGMPFIVVNQLHYPNSTIAFIDTGFSIGVLVGSIGANFLQKRGAFINKIFIPLVVLSIGYVLMGLLFVTAPGITMVKIIGLLLNLVMAMSVAILNVSMGVRMQSTVPTKLLGRVNSLITTACQIAMPVGTLIFTGIFQVVSNASIVFIFAGIVMVAYVLVCIPIFAKNVRQDDQFVKEHEADLASDAEES